MDDRSTLNTCQSSCPENSEAMDAHREPQVKFGAQVTMTKSGAWSVTQLIQKSPKRPYTVDTHGGVIFVRQSKLDSETKLLTAIQRALAGQIDKTIEV